MTATAVQSAKYCPNGMLLSELLAGIDWTSLPEKMAATDQPVNMLTADSRQIQTGGVFVAMTGTAADGHRYLEAAVAKGALAVVVQRGLWQPEQLAGWNGLLVEVADSRLAYALLAENWYRHPATNLTCIAITGTNGKTTISYLLEQVLLALGRQVAVIGTVNYRYTTSSGTVVEPAPNTTPDALQLQGLLRRMRDAGVDTVIMEVSSHALAQKRIGTLSFTLAAFTNLSHDHLDYHRNMEAYFQAKSLLFGDHLQSAGTAVISIPQQSAPGANWSEQMADFCREHGKKTLLCGVTTAADLQLLDSQSTLTASTIRLGGRYGDMLLTSPLVGHFNVDNLLTTIGLLLAAGIAKEVFLPLLEKASGAPGRLQRIQCGDSARHPVVFVDYAHTPDAVRQVLLALRELPHGELYCVFGCGGDRDGSKRPRMGAFACELADVLLVTDDNPRSEEPAAIRDAIEVGIVEAGGQRRAASWLLARPAGERGYVVEGERSQAIRLAIEAARPGDIVAILGKGHETYQISRSGKVFFDDRLEAASVLADWNSVTIAAAIGGFLQEGRVSPSHLRAVSTDSRTIGRGDIFVALSGENFDGHAFQIEVQEKGAGCLVVRKGQRDPAVRIDCVEVADTLQALHDLARYRRRLMAALTTPAVIAITGSCGKTTTKEMLAAILRRHWPAGPDHPANAVLHTRGNLNNLIGLPLSLLPLQPCHRAAVLEMGMNVPGEIARMTTTAEPDICCITNVHGVHLEGLGSIEGVARAKEELFASAPPHAVLILNGDNPHIMAMAPRYQQQQLVFSTRGLDSCPQANFWAEDIVTQPGQLSFTLHDTNKAVAVTIPAIGVHNVANALAAAAAAAAAGVDLAVIAAGLADFQTADKRMAITRSRYGLLLLNDTYNANPASMVAALQTLIDQAGGSRTVAILGDMLELGAVAENCHRDLGQKAAALGIRYLAVVGAFAATVVLAARQAGMPVDGARAFASKEEAVSWVESLCNRQFLTAEDVLLVKGSRGMRMETVVAQLTA